VADSGFHQSLVEVMHFFHEGDREIAATLLGIEELDGVAL
jgi:hypothetical protein